MKKNIITFTVLSLLSLCACDVREDYKTPDAFVNQLNSYFDPYCELWNCKVSDREYRDSYTDYSGKIKHELLRIKEYQTVSRLKEDTDSYIVYYSYSHAIPRMTIYDSGYIEISSGDTILDKSYYYRIDSELATSIHSNVIKAIEYYKSVEEKSDKESKEAVKVQNFFKGIKNLKVDGSFCDIKSDYCPKYILDSDDGLIETLKSITYTPLDDGYFAIGENIFHCTFTNESDDISYYEEINYTFTLSDSYDLCRLGYEFYDEIGALRIGESYCSISKEDGHKIYDYLYNRFVLKDNQQNQ